MFAHDVDPTLLDGVSSSLDSGGLERKINFHNIGEIIREYVSYPFLGRRFYPLDNFAARKRMGQDKTIRNGHLMHCAQVPLQHHSAW